MKKKFLTGFVFVFFIGTVYCQAQPKGEYTVPVNLTGEARDAVIAHIERGKILFKKKCSKCHGIFTDGKEKIPNFSKQELKSYDIQFIREDPENHAFSQKMTEEELSDVTYFLQFYLRPDAKKPAAAK